MTAIEASSVSVKTMADNTLRLTVDIEPRFAKDAFALFGERGTAMALAALKPDHQKPEPELDRLKGGEIAKWLGIRCGEGTFQSWLSEQWPVQWRDAMGDTVAKKAAGVIRAVCGVESRAEFDNDKYAATRFHTLIRGPYQKHLIAIGVTA